MIPNKTEERGGENRTTLLLGFSFFFFSILAGWLFGLLDGIPAHEKRAYDTTLYDKFIDDVTTMGRHFQKTWTSLYLIFFSPFWLAY